VPRAVALIVPSVQGDYAGIGHVEQELPFLGFRTRCWQAAQLDLQYFLELMPLQRMKTRRLCRGGS